jgi:hypothetical protein
VAYDPFINIDDLYAYLRLPALGVNETDDLSTIALDSACYTIRGFLHQTINLVTDDTIAIDADGSARIMLPEAPVVSVSSVGTLSTYTDFTVTAYDTTQYLVDYDKGAIEFRGAYFPNRVGAVQVTYTHGWEVIPTDIRIVALTLAARIYDQGLAKAETIGNTRLVYSHDESLGLSPREKDMLVKYRRSGVPNHYRNYGITT